MSNCIKCNAVLQDGSLFCHVCGKKQTTQPHRTATRRGNGSGSVYKRGNVWEAAVVLGYKLDDNGKAVAIRATKRGFKTKKEALEYIPQLRLEKPRKTPTLYELFHRFRESRQYDKLSASRKEKYSIVWRKIDKESYVQIDHLTVSDLQRMVDRHANSFYPARDIKDLLSKLYQLALPDQYVRLNLAEYIELPDRNSSERQAFSQDDVEKLWNDYLAGNWWTGYIILMIYTGMMPSELLGLHKDQIDWKARLIRDAGRKTKVRKETPIVLADCIIPVLADLCEHTPSEKVIAINKDNFYKRYYETLARVGCKRLSPYSTRHTTASALALENVNPNIIKRVMRHASFATTQGYIHIDTSAILDAVNQLKKPE